jgi:hypothetical protein
MPFEPVQFALIRPVLGSLNIIVAHRIVADVFPLRGVRITTTELTIPKITLPKRKLPSVWPVTRNAILPE